MHIAVAAGLWFGPVFLAILRIARRRGFGAGNRDERWKSSFFTKEKS